MARSTLLLFGVILTVCGLFLVVGGMDGSERVESTDGGSPAGGGAAAAAEGMGADAAPSYMEEGEPSRPRAVDEDVPATEEGHASGGDESDGAFRDLPDLSSGGRVPRLRQSTLMETFASSSQIGQPDLGMGEEIGSESQDSAEDDDEEEEQAEGEHAMQGRRPAKRLRHFSGAGLSGWSTLIGDGPLEGYRRRPSAMLRFRTIAAYQVNQG